MTGLGRLLPRPPAALTLAPPLWLWLLLVDQAHSCVPGSFCPCPPWQGCYSLLAALFSILRSQLKCHLLREAFLRMEQLSSARGAWHCAAERALGWGSGLQGPRPDSPGPACCVCHWGT